MHAKTGSQGGIRFVTLLLAVVFALGLAWPAAARAGPVGAASPSRWLAPLALAAPAKAKARPAAKSSAREAPKATAAPKTAQLAPRGEQARDEKLYKALTAAWSQFYANKLKDAAATAEPLIASEVEWARVEALHIQARCLHAAGPQYHARAAQTWSRLQAQSTLNSNLIRLEIGKALAAMAAKPSAGEAPKGRPADAAAALDAALRRGVPGTCTPEAAIELGRAYVAQKQWDNARKAFDFAIAYSQSQAKAGKELPGYVYAPFIAEAKEALALLKFDRDEGREEFERAQKLRADKKYADAGRLYQAIAKKYPESNYAPRSELHLGHCLLGLNQAREAVAHWQKFISAQPAGPWRGQAYSETIDLCLQTVFDLDNAVRFAHLAQTSLASAMSDKSAAASWQAGMFDLQLGLGIVAFIRNDNASAAAAFSRAASAAPKTVKKNFPALIAAAKAGKPLLPPDVSGMVTSVPHGNSGAGSASGVSAGSSGAGNVTLALAMGRIYRLAGDEDASRRMFALVASAKLGRPSPAQLAYAQFATGDALDADKKHAQARDEYVESLKAFPRGSWQDESLFRVARFIQNEADKKFGLPDAKDKPAPDPASKAEQERLKKLTDASAASLDYWAALVQHFPKSRHRETALFQAARIFADTRKWPEAAALADKLAAEYPNSKSAPKLLYEIGAALAAIQQWPDAVKIADRLAAAYPKEPFAPKLLYEVGVALLKAGKFKDTTDLAEKMIATFPKDPNGPKLFYSVGILLSEMAEKSDPLKTEPLWQAAMTAFDRFCRLAPKSPEAGEAFARQLDIALEKFFDARLAQALAVRAAGWAKDSLASGPTGSRSNNQDVLTCKRSIHNCLLRCSLASYLGGNFDQAVEWLELSNPQSLGQGFTDNPDLQSLGMHCLLKAIRSRNPVTDQQALDTAGTEQQRLAIQLGDLYLAAIRPGRAEEIFAHIINHDARLGKVSAGIEGYAMLQTATALDRQEGRRAEALQVLKKIVAQRELQGTYWGGCGLFRLALFTYNQSQDVKQSIPLYQQMLRQYPHHELAELAHLYLCLDAIELKDRALVERESRSFLARNTKPEYRALIQRRMEMFAKQSDETNKR